MKKGFWSHMLKLIYPILLYFLIVDLVSFCVLFGIMFLDITKAAYEQLPKEYTLQQMQEFIDQYPAEEKVEEYEGLYLTYQDMIDTGSHVVALIPVIIIFAVRRRMEIRKKKVSDNMNYSLGWFLVPMFAGVGISIAGTIIGKMMKIELVSVAEMMNVAEASHDTILWRIQNSLAFQIVSGAVILPIVEEMLFCGLAYKEIRSWQGPVAAVLWSALLFATGCSGNGVFFAALACGFVCALLYERYQSIFAPIIFRFGLEMIKILMNRNKVVTDELFSSGVRLWSALLFGLILAATAFLLIIYYMFPKKYIGSDKDGN